jgi:hypothetical protein
MRKEKSRWQMTVSGFVLELWAQAQKLNLRPFHFSVFCFWLWSYQ